MYFKRIHLRHSSITAAKRSKRNMKQASRFLKALRYKQRFFKRFFLDTLDIFHLYKWNDAARNFIQADYSEKFLLRLVTWLRIFFFKYKMKFAC